MIHPIELVICSMIFKGPLQKYALPGNLKQVFQVSIYVSPKPEMSLKKQFTDKNFTLQSRNTKYSI